MNSMFDLSGKVCVVTGGNSGIGLGMAEGLARQGASVVIWGTNGERNQLAAEQLLQHDVPVSAQLVDVSSEQAVADAMQTVLEEFGRMDQVIANAGISIPRKSMFDISHADLKDIEAVNTHGAFFTMREAARHMVERAESGDPGGSIVVVASTAVIMGAARSQHYAGTKGAVLAIAKAMAVELAKHRISVNTIVPGWVRSNMTEDLQAWEKFQEMVISRVPMGDWLDGSDFAGIAAYLASDASRQHTGDEFVIDGGYTKF